MSIKITDDEGREFEFSGEYRQYIEGDYFLSAYGDVRKANGLWLAQGSYHGDTKAIVHLIPIPKPPPEPIYHDFCYLISH